MEIPIFNFPLKLLWAFHLHLKFFSVRKRQQTRKAWEQLGLTFLLRTIPCSNLNPWFLKDCLARFTSNDEQKKWTLGAVLQLCHRANGVWAFFSVQFRGWLITVLNYPVIFPVTIVCWKRCGRSHFPRLPPLSSRLHINHTRNLALSLTRVPFY